MSEKSKSDLHLLIDALNADSIAFFGAASIECKDHEPESGIWYSRLESDHFWNLLKPEIQAKSIELTERLLRYSARLSILSRDSPLTGPEDGADLRESAKTARAALRMRKYVYRQIEIINDEDRILGVRPPEQTDHEALHPDDALRAFQDSLARVEQTLILIQASADLMPASAANLPAPETNKYRPRTAFIMMWMDKSKPGLSDVADSVKETFRRFGVKAVRSDDIEHEGQITQRVLDEIRTSEFLFADLSGERPNVYYEIGFAHALGKHVILYREEGTSLHFDLKVYNCPEYRNLGDLKKQLTKRLDGITNRNVSDTNGET